jgi:predicted PurR-regulated permease PerM
MAMLFTGAPISRWLWFLAAYAAIAILDGLVLQPFLMRRQNRVPFWASLLTPILLGIVIPFWGVLLAPPLLAIIYAYRGAAKPQTPPGGNSFPPMTVASSSRRTTIPMPGSKPSCRPL